MDQHVRDFGHALATLTVVTAPVFYFTQGSAAVGFVRVTPLVLGVLLVVTALGVAATARRSVALATGAFAVALGAALLQLGQAGRQSNLLDGNGSTFSLLLGLGLGWLSLALALRTTEAVTAPDRDS